VSAADVTTPDLSGLAESAEDSSYAATGFSGRHTAGADRIVAVAEAFAGAGYFLEMLTAEDRREDLNTMRVVYTFNRLDRLDRHLVVVNVAGEIPGAEAPSVSGVFASADWYEREVYDMYGVRFGGHPDLKRILLPDDSDFHALLKDFGRIEDAEGADAGGGEDA